ncbi:MAG: hypothetical protein JWN38_1262 [Candidatus Saccharibacteria bacterium]|nr:hypothetical protein [Candidatus Saccharibacteria bacterium]
MLKIDDNLLQEIGLGGLPDAEKNSLLKHIYETLEMRVGMRLADQMSNEQLDEFERYFEAKDDAGAFKWLETNFPNYKDIVQEEFDKLRAEVAASAPQILVASQQQAQLPPQQPAAIPQQYAPPAPQQYAPQPQPQQYAPAPQPYQPPQPAPQGDPGYQPQQAPAPAQPYAAPPEPQQYAPAPQPQYQPPQPVQPQYPSQQPPAGPAV